MNRLGTFFLELAMFGFGMVFGFGVLLSRAGPNASEVLEMVGGEQTSLLFFVTPAVTSVFISLSILFFIFRPSQQILEKKLRPATIRPIGWVVKDRHRGSTRYVLAFDEGGRLVLYQIAGIRTGKFSEFFGNLPSLAMIPKVTVEYRTLRFKNMEDAPREVVWTKCLDIKTPSSV